MRTHRLLVAAMAVPAWLSLSVDAAARDLTFEERVRAQEAIDRVYHTHESGAVGRFEDSVPRTALEEKVRRYLKETVALETRWNVRITAGMLRDELDRATRDTRMPDRLREMFAALGDDPFVIQECLIRPLLVERLARARFTEEIAHPAPATADGEGERDWSRWWRANAHLFDEREAVAVATSADTLRLPDTATAGACLPDQTWSNGSLMDDHVARTQHSAIWTGTLMVIWGGQDAAGHVLNTGERYDPVTDAWTSISAAGAPSARRTHAAIWTGSRMVVWGGTDGATVFTSGGRYDPASDTWSPVSQLNAPEARNGASVAWTGARMIVWSGLSVSTVQYVTTGASYDPVNDVWTPTSQVNAPEGRYQHAAVWTGQRMLVWGGLTGAGYVATGGAYDPSIDAWFPLSVAGAPTPRFGHGAVWTGRFMTVWGGQDSTGYAATGGRYDPGTDTWLPTTTTNAPPGRVPAPPVWTGSRMIVFGGDAGGPLDTGGRYDPEADVWTSVSMLNAPLGRDNHTMVWTGDRVIVWGGENQGAPLTSGGRYDPSADDWSPTSDPYRPGANDDQSAVWTGNEMLVWGGVAQTSPSVNTGARYDPALDVWKPMSTLNAPPPRGGNTAVWTGRQMIVWGGRSGIDPSALGDGGRYDPLTDVWSPVSMVGAPSARLSHASVWTGSLLLIWGGESSEASYLTTGGRYDPQSDSWSAMSQVNVPSGHAGSSAVWTGTRMIVWSGLGGPGGYAPMGARYDPAADHWEPISLANAPAPRASHATVWTGKSMIVWGGIGNGGQQMTGGVYDPAADHWTPTTTFATPSPRIDLTAVWTGGRMIVWGGWNGSSGLDTGGIYDPVADAWVATSQAGAPPPRTRHTAVWTGSLMVIWGGQTNPTSATGGRFAYGALADADHDGYTVCDGDCDDSRPEVHPGAAEVCDGLDNDCNGVVDDLPASFCDDGNACTADSCGGTAGCLHPIRDRDGDGYRDALCGGNDCDDLDPLRHPGAPERCNGLDDNCDTIVDEGGDALCDDHDLCTDVDACRGVLGCYHHARDVDGDGHGDATCGGDDCDDMNAAIWFPPVEVANLGVSGASPTSLSWTDQAPLVGADILYLLVSGTITSPGSNGFAGAVCLQVGSGPAYQETRPDPPTGTAYWYLTRAVDECGNGTYGTPQRDAGLSAVCY